MNYKRLLKWLEALGHWFFYVTLRLFGHRGGIILLVPVVAIYTLCSRKIHKIISHYLRRRFPGESALRYRMHGYCNLLSFGKVLVERGWLGVGRHARLEGKFEGYDHLLELIKQGRGVVLLTGHVGNWQSALAHLENLPVKVYALMRYDQNAAAKHFFDLGKGRRQFEIIDADGDFGGMVDAVAALQRGEVVTIMADRYVRGSSSEVRFMGDQVRFPDGAYLLAASNSAPVAVIFAAKTGRNSYTLRLWDSFFPSYGERDERSAMLMDGTRRFAQSLEAYLKRYPYQWYNFYNFWQQ